MKKKKSEKRPRTGFILAIIAVAILVFNIILILFGKTWLIKEMKSYGIPEENIKNIVEVMPYLLAFYIVCVLWLLFLIILFEKKKTKAWWIMLVLGIVIVFFGRIESGILSIIASFFYRKSLQK